MNDSITKKDHRKWILPLLILLIAGVGSVALVKSHKTPAKKSQTNPGLLVETIPLVRKTERALVYATGTAEPSQEISLVSEVNGKLTWVSPLLVEGGFFRQGEKLLEIDPRDYRLAIERAEADVAAASTLVQTETEQSGVARREWERIELPDKGSPSALVLRQPQLNGAKATLAAAQAGLELAKLNLERTSIFAPFNGRLRSKQVDLGEYVRTGSPLAVFAGTDQAEIIAPLQIAELSWLDIPGAGSGNSGSPCTVTALIGETRFRWNGTVNRTFGEIDNASRMARIAISVADPYQLKEPMGATPPLSNGLFVNIEIEGASLGAVVRIPRSALREGDVVWLADENDRLEIRPVQVLRRQQQSLLINEGLQGGERLILTNISGPATGLKLRPQNSEQQP